MAPVRHAVVDDQLAHEADRVLGAISDDLAAGAIGPAAAPSDALGGVRSVAAPMASPPLAPWSAT